MQKQGNIFFNRSINAIIDQPSLAKEVAKLKERCPPHPKKIFAVDII
jgi:hypothetical protein